MNSGRRALQVGPVPDGEEDLKGRLFTLEVVEVAAPDGEGRAEEHPLVVVADLMAEPVDRNRRGKNRMPTDRAVNLAMRRVSSHPLVLPRFSLFFFHLRFRNDPFN